MMPQFVRPLAAPTPITLPEAIQTGGARAINIGEALQRITMPRYAPGGAGVVQGEQTIAEQYGKDSPEYARAQLWNQVNEYEKKQRGDFMGANLKFKNLTPFQKDQTALEIQKETGLPISQIYKMLSDAGDVPSEPMTTNPTGTNPNSPEPNTSANPGSQAHAIQNTYIQGEKQKNEANQQIEQTEAKLAKDVGNKAAQNALPPLIDIAKTINGINYTPVANFSGLHGKAYAMMERAKAATGIGQTSPEFKAYDNFVQSQGKLLADATRQALATSVRQPYVREMLMPLTNTAVWYESPELAMNRFNYFRDWLNDRMKIYHHLATKGVSPNLKEINDVMGIGKPTDQQIKDIPASNEDIQNMSTEELMKIAQGGQ